MILCLLELRFKGCLATVAVTAGTPLILLCKLLKIGDGKWHHGNNDYTEAGVCNAASQFHSGGVNYTKKEIKYLSLSWTLVTDISFLYFSCDFPGMLVQYMLIL